MANAPHSNGGALAGPVGRVPGNMFLDQFGAPLQVPYDPAWQAPSDPLVDRPRTIDRARVINREIPNVVVETGWSPGAVRCAIQDLVVGLFDRPAQLHDAISSDSRVQSANRSRAAGLLGKPFRFGLPRSRKARRDPLAKKCLRLWKAHWPKMEAEPAILNLLQQSNSLGFAYAQVLWDTSGRTWYPYLSSWNARYSYYHWLLRCHVAITMDGQTPVTPGDAHWVLHAPYGQYRGWMQGTLRPVAQWWLARNYALRDWARYSERHGFPIIIADTPFGADPQSIANYQQQLTQLGQESVLQVPGSVDLTKYGKYDLRYLEPKDRNWQGFKELIIQCNSEITLAMLGQNLTSEIKEGSMAAARVHANVLQTWLAADARALSQTLYRDVLRPFAALNFGDADLAPVPIWDVSPPEDLETKARTLQFFGQGINQLRLGGVRIKKLEKFATKFGLDLGEIEPVDPIQVEARLAGSTGKVESDAEQEKNESGDEQNSKLDETKEAVSALRAQVQALSAKVEELEDYAE
jgi:phage gp29-like protein